MIVIESQLEAIHEGLREVEKYSKYLDGNILKRFGAGVKSRGKKEVKALVTQRSGAMYKGVVYYYDAKNKRVVITNNATGGTKDARYPWILATGKRLDPRSGKTINFGVRDWIERPGHQYMSSIKAEEDIQKVIDSFMRGLEKKGILKYE
jgi:hypothetical protein